MIRTLISLVIFFLIGWVAYTTFFGTEEDKALRNRLFSTGKDFFGAIADIAKSEQSKIKDGTYDQALESLDKLIDELKANNEGGNYAQRIKQLEKDRQQLESLLDQAKDGPQGRVVPGGDTYKDGKLEELSKKIDLDAKKIIEDMEKDQQ